MASRRHIKVVRTTVYPIPKQARRKRIPKQITVYGADTYNNSRVNLFNADHSYSEHDTWDKRPPTRGWTAGRIHQSRTDRRTGDELAVLRSTSSARAWAARRKPVLAITQPVPRSTAAHNAHVAKKQHHSLCAHFLVLCEIGSTVNRFDWGNRSDPPE